MISKVLFSCKQQKSNSNQLNQKGGHLLEVIVKAKGVLGSGVDGSKSWQRFYELGLPPAPQWFMLSTLCAGLSLHHRETVFVLIVPSCSATSTPKGFFQKRKFQVPAELKGDRIDGSLKWQMISTWALSAFYVQIEVEKGRSIPRRTAGL